MNDISTAEIHADSVIPVNHQEQENTLIQQLQWNTKRFMLSHTTELGFIQPHDYETILNSSLTLGKEQKNGESFLVGIPSRIGLKDKNGYPLETYENPATIKINGKLTDIWIVFDREGTPHKIFDKPPKQVPSRRTFLKIVGGATLGLFVVGEISKVPGTIQDASSLLTHLTESSEMQILPEMNTEIQFADAYSVMPSLDGNTIIAVNHRDAELLRNTIPGSTPQTIPIHFEWFNQNGEKTGENVFPIFLDTGNGSIDDIELPHSLSVGDGFAIYYHHKGNTPEIEAAYITPETIMSNLKYGTLAIPGTNHTVRYEDNDSRKKLYIGSRRGNEIVEAPMLVLTPSETESFDIFSNIEGTFVVRKVTYDRELQSYEAEHSLYSNKGEFIMNFPKSIPEYAVRYVDDQHQFIVLVDDDSNQEISLKIYSKEKGFSESHPLKIQREDEESPRNIQYTRVSRFGDSIVAASLETFDEEAVNRGVQIQTFDVKGNPQSSTYIEIPKDFITKDFSQPFLWSVHDSYVTFYKQSGSLINIPYS